jgi:hypothetical protein
MTDEFAVSDYRDLASAIRARIIELNISLETAETLAGIAPGYLAKITSDPPQRRASPYTLLLVLQALSLRLTLTVDPQMLERMKHRYEPRKIKMVRAQAWTQRIIELTPDYRRRVASLGGQARARLSNLSEINRRANLTRWRRVREQRAQSNAAIS